MATYIAQHPYINTAMLKIIDLKTKGNLNLVRKLYVNIFKYASLFLKMSHTLVYKSKTKQRNVAMMAKFAEKGMWNAKKKNADKGLT